MGHVVFAVLQPDESFEYPILLICRDSWSLVIHRDLG